MSLFLGLGCGRNRLSTHKAKDLSDDHDHRRRWAPREGVLVEPAICGYHTPGISLGMHRATRSRARCDNTYSEVSKLSHEGRIDGI